MEKKKPTTPHRLESASRATGTGAGKRGRRHAAHDALLFHRPKKRHIWIGVIIVVLLALAVGGIFLFTDFEFAAVTRAITAWVDTLNPLAVVPLMALLPIVGFPISIVYLIAGARFGVLGGGLVVALVTACHLAGTHLVARSFLRGPIERFVERRHKKLPAIPEDEQVAVSVVVALVPGLPYFVRNCLLALSGVRLRTYFWTCLPIYLARSYVTIMLGDLSGDPTRRGLIVLVVVDVLKVLICAGVIWWLRRHHRRVHGHEHDHDVHHGGDSVRPIPAAQR
jgi:uncharacterized membrane protein YdjX (TVP38/TMEM64 family)